ncbi:hypothetical protein NE237_016621 [Protea cynaroides]|uniref:Cyclin-dependent kinase inhibitor n=1 Tax=Protea cynaroides TaxID=273540 RepID=A0A9Q0K6H2_9MAGN|nr:hypothetical protein NE237_016621 [Protea cynaroides]
MSGKGREVARLRFPIGGENPGVRPLLRIRATGVAVDDDERGSEKEEWTGEGVATVLGEEEEKIREPNNMMLGMERNCMFTGLGSEPMKLSRTSLVISNLSVRLLAGREKTSSSEFRVESGDLESTARPAAANSRHRSTTENMPMETEIEDFFSAAEKEQQKLFADKVSLRKPCFGE